MQRIILDTDPGVDDALAIALAVNSSGLKVEAVTTVNGNVSVDYCTRNLSLIIGAMGNVSVPIIAKGESQPLSVSIVNASHVHGSDGLGGVTQLRDSNGDRCYSEMLLPSVTVGAVDVILEVVKQYPSQIILLCIGPLTNIAKAILTCPIEMKKVKGIVLMGGAFEVYGNVTLSAEFNVYADPHAAQVVFESGIPVTIVPLDVTHQVLLDAGQFEELCVRHDGQWGRFLLDCTKVCFEFHCQHEGLDGFYLHDPVAVGYLEHPGFFDTVPAYVQVETTSDLTRGRTVADLRSSNIDGPEPNAQVCVGINTGQFLDYFLDRIFASA